MTEILRIQPVETPVFRLEAVGGIPGLRGVGDLHEHAAARALFNKIAPNLQPPKPGIPRSAHQEFFIARFHEPDGWRRAVIRWTGDNFEAAYEGFSPDVRARAFMWMLARLASADQRARDWASSAAVAP